MASQSTNSTIAVIVDTNCFIQARDLKDLPWRKLVPGVRCVEIVVVPTVIDELDAFKVERGQRVRDRARLALDLVRQAGRSDDMRIVLKNTKDIRVELLIADVGRIDWDAYPNLDQAKADDRVVAEALTFGGNTFKVFLSHDTGPLIRSRRAGLEALEVPEEWLLPPQVDETAKELARLKRENEELKRRAPVLEVTWLMENKPVEEIVIERLVLTPLGGTAIAALVVAAQEAIPLETGVFAPSLGFSIGGEPGFTQDDFYRYHAEYQRFISSLPKFFEEMHGRIHRASATTAVSYRVENQGSATAEGLTVDFAIAEEWIVFADEEQAEDFYGVTVSGPKPPLTPRMHKVAEADRLGRSLFTNLPQKPRDPTGFYWETRPTGIAHRGVLRCEEFRAKRIWDDTIWLYPWKPESREVILNLDVHSKTGSSPIVKSLLLRVEDRKVDWADPRVLECTEGWIKTVLKTYGEE